MLLLCVLALVRYAHAQYGAYVDGSALPRPGPQRETCGYESCLPIKPGWLNVHVVPQTHSELGHGFNFHQHYTGEEAPLVKTDVNMKRILDAVITELWEDSRRSEPSMRNVVDNTFEQRLVIAEIANLPTSSANINTDMQEGVATATASCSFQNETDDCFSIEPEQFTLSETAYLFHWWNNRHPTVQGMMHTLVRQGRLSIAGGGLSISDEASTSYHSIIDQFTYSLRKLNSTFQACGRPLVAWAVDVYGHSKEFTSLMTQMGFDALFINPISYDDEAARMRRQSLEFLWRGSDDLGAVTDMFTHNLFDGYWAPPGFCFSQLCSDPLLIAREDSHLLSNLDDRVNKFIESLVYRQAPNYGTRNIMVIMGHRKAYFDARVWFNNIEKLMSYTNVKAFEKGFNMTVFYSNPACYLAAVHDENPELETKQDDFFPYVHDRDSYTVGMYTSRPTLKYLIREAHVYLQMAKQLQVTANMGEHKQLFQEFNWIMGVVQDHSVATGVLRQPVKDYYVQKLVAAIDNSTEMTSRAFTKLRESPTHIPYRRCLFNISLCRETRYTKFTIQVYNPLSWPVTMPVRLPIYPVHSKYKVFDANDAEVKSVKIKLSDAVIKINGRIKADHELVFIATNLPPLGFRSYYIESQFFKIKDVKRVKMDEMNKYFLNVPTEKGTESKQLDVIDKKTVYKEMYVDKVKGTNMRRFNSEKETNREMKVLGSNAIQSEIKKKRTSWSKRSFMVHANTSNTESSTSEGNNIFQDESEGAADFVISEPTTETEPILLPMLREFLKKQSIFSKPDLSDTENLIAPSDELTEEKALPTDDEDPYTVNPSDIKVPSRKSGIMPTIDADTITTDTADRDIQIAFKERTTLKPAKGILDESANTKVQAAIQTVSTESDIVVPISNYKVPIEHETKELDIMIPVRKKNSKHVTKYNKTHSKIVVPVRTTTLPIPVRIKSEEIAPTSSVSLEIVPVRTTVVPTTTPPILAVRVEETTKTSLMSELSATTTANDSNTAIELSVRNEEQNKTAESSLKLPDIPLKFDETKSARKHIPIKPEVFKIDVDTYGLNTGAIKTNTNSKILANFQESTTEEPSTDTYSTIDHMAGFSTDDYLSVLAKETKTTSTEKYFKVENASTLFIGNKYVRVNLDQNKRLTSIFLRNGVRMNLRIQMFYYQSDDPERFDLRHVPRRNIKPPGAYIFRPLDPRIISLKTDYQVNIIKTSIVEVAQIRFNEWASLVMRLYVDSPVIEVQWLVGPIPTDDGGKDVFVRYSTDLDHGAEFHTDSNGRQTIKRIRGLRAAYKPMDLHPITGNLYPVTSKIYIEDPKRNIRFAVFNDRCQAGGSLVEGAIDLMLHRRILTDDIGFGAYLNETELEEGIRVTGTHYLYVTKSDKNRIFEKKFAKEIAMAPRVLTSGELSYSDHMKEEFSELKNEFSALKEKLPVGVHLLTLERLSDSELLIRLENYLERADVNNGIRYVALRSLFVDVRIVWLKETTLAANMFKDSWAPPKWRTKNTFYRSFNEFYGTGNDRYEDYVENVRDEYGGRGVRLAPQQIRTFIVKYAYV